MIDILGSTYAIEPIDRGLSKRVHRSGLKPYGRLVTKPRKRVKEVHSAQCAVGLSDETTEADLIVKLFCLTPQSEPYVADGVGLPGVMASSECDWDSEGAIKDAQSEEMGSAVSDLSSIP